MHAASSDEVEGGILVSVAHSYAFLWRTLSPPLIHTIVTLIHTITSPPNSVRRDGAKL